MPPRWLGQRICHRWRSYVPITLPGQTCYCGYGSELVTTYVGKCPNAVLLSLRQDPSLGRCNLPSESSRTVNKKSLCSVSCSGEELTKAPFGGEWDGTQSFRNDSPRRNHWATRRHRWPCSQTVLTRCQILRMRVTDPLPTNPADQVSCDGCESLNCRCTGKTWSTSTLYSRFLPASPTPVTKIFFVG